MNVAYVRVSTEDQTVDRQIDNMKDYNIEKIFSENASAKDLNRPVLQEMLQFIRQGDVLYVDEFSRLARNTKDLLTIVDVIKEKGVRLISLKENFDIDTPIGKAMLAMTGAMGQMERDYILERQREGVRLAKLAGKFKGSRKKECKDFDKYYAKYKARVINKKEFALLINVSRPTLDRMIKDFEAKGVILDKEDEKENIRLRVQIEELEKKQENSEERDKLIKEMAKKLNIDEEQLAMLAKQKRKRRRIYTGDLNMDNT